MSSRRPIFSCFSKKENNKLQSRDSFYRFYLSYNIKVIEIGQAASSAMIKPNSGRIITVFRKLGLSNALTICLS